MTNVFLRKAAHPGDFRKGKSGAFLHDKRHSRKADAAVFFLEEIFSIISFQIRLRYTDI